MLKSIKGFNRLVIPQDGHIFPIDWVIIIMANDNMYSQLRHHYIS